MTKAEGIVFEDPPPRMADKNFERWGDTVGALKERPGTWARIFEKNSPSRAAALAGNIRRGQIAAFLPTGSFEAKSRTIDGHFYVYARYVGEESA